MTAAGSGTSFSIVRSARRHWPTTASIITIDTNQASHTASSHLADDHYVVPEVRDSSYVEVLLRGLDEHQVTLVWPVLDLEISLLAQLSADGGLPGVDLIAPSVRGARLCGDKLAIHTLLRQQGLPTPETRLYVPGEYCGRGVLKPRCFGFGSHGVRITPLEEDFEASEELIWQEHLPGREYTVDCFVDLNGEVFAQARQRLTVKAGVCTKALFVASKAMEQLARDLVSVLELNGAFCFQMIEGGDGEPRVTDVNPRPGAGTALSVAAGFDPIAATLASHLGEDPYRFLDAVTPGTIATRSYQEWVSAP